MTTDANEAGHIRLRATASEMAVRNDALFQIVREHQPTGIRFVYYTATTRGIVPKTDSGYVKIQRAILMMRHSGRLPWEWIVDTNRWMRKPTTWGSVDELLADAAYSYRRALWRDADVLVEVWCESESVAGVLLPVTEKWDVPLYPIKGQTSDSFAYGAAQSYRDDQRRVGIFYVGDHDPAGYEIQSNLEAKLRAHSGRSGRSLVFERLACTLAQIEDLDLWECGTSPKKTTWRNARTGDRLPWVGPAIEVEALEPPYLRGVLDGEISSWIDPEALRLLRVAEDSEREVFTRMAGLS